MDHTGNLVFEKQTVMKIDSAAIHANVTAIRERIGSAKLIAVVKENGYGMGLKREYELLKASDIDYYAVTNVHEALALREFGCRADILLMSPSYNMEEIALLTEHDIVCMTGSLKQVALIMDNFKKTGKKTRVHLGIETGMGRYGFLWNQIPDLKEFQTMASIEGCYSHLNGKPKDYEKTAMLQKEHLLAAVDAIKAQGINPGMLHICNSAATMVFGSMGLDAVRCGSAILGKVARGGNALKPAVWLEAPICEVSELPKGSTIGYQACAVLKQDSRLGLVRAGHGDGIMLGYADNPEPLFHGILHLLSVNLRKKRYEKRVLVTDRKTGKKARVPYVGRSGIAHVMIDLTGSSFDAGDTVRFDVNPLFIHPSIKKEII